MQICVYWKCMKLDISLTCRKSPCFLPVKTKNEERNETEDFKFYKKQSPRGVL